MSPQSEHDTQNTLNHEAEMDFKFARESVERLVIAILECLKKDNSYAGRKHAFIKAQMAWEKFVEAEMALYADEGTMTPLLKYAAGIKECQSRVESLSKLFSEIKSSLN
ncbi:MAG: hypothetical protein CVT73_05695 [Alphaproteobacteria bacterium HGW-Alphaproteobacteria-12]|nr:MAG: hypothetical protein CVT73_05695 [Alphaproteobacteria bacterium HGW-Alphaproteobacteria-12]